MLSFIKSRMQTNVLLGICAIGLLACGDVDDTTGQTNNETSEVVVANIAILDRNSDDAVITSTNGLSWDGSLPTMSVGGTPLSLSVRALDENGDEIELDFDNEHDFASRLAEGEADDVVSIRHCMMRGCTITITPGEDTGETKVHFLVKSHGEIIYESPAIALTVAE